MLNCRQVTELCSAELERDLRWPERASLRVHLMMCSGCNHFHAQMHLLRAAMRGYADGAAVSTTDDPGPAP